MQFLSAKAVIYIRVLALVAFLFFLVKNPATFFNSNFTILLGEAMRLPMIQVTQGNPLFGLLSLFVGLFALSDLVPVMAENISHFETFVPIRLGFFFILATFCMISEYSLIANNVVFTYSFMEVWLNFLIFTNLRDEKYQRAKEFLEKHGDELREMANERVVPIDDDN